MDNSDLLGAIDIVRDALFTDEEEEQLQRIIDRLEGYELAYSVILKENERLKKQVKKFQEDIEIKDKHFEMIKQSSRDYQKAFEDVEKEVNKWKLSDYRREQEVNNLKHEMDELKELLKYKNLTCSTHILEIKGLQEQNEQLEKLKEKIIQSAGLPSELLTDKKD